MSDFMIVKNGTAIKCMTCNMVSEHAMDVKYRYCGNCKKFIDPDRLPWTELDPEFAEEMGRTRAVQYLQQQSNDRSERFDKETLEREQEFNEKMRRACTYILVLLATVAATGAFLVGKVIYLSLTGQLE